MRKTSPIDRIVKKKIAALRREAKIAKRHLDRTDVARYARALREKYETASVEFLRSLAVSVNVRL